MGDIEKDKKRETLVFSPEIPADLEYALQIRDETFDWLEILYWNHSFTSGEVLSMAGEPVRRWLIYHPSEHDIGNEGEFSLPDTAFVLTSLFLLSKVAKFRDSVDAVIGKREVWKAYQ